MATGSVLFFLMWKDSGINLENKISKIYFFSSVVPDACSILSVQVQLRFHLGINNNMKFNDIQVWRPLLLSWELETWLASLKTVSEFHVFVFSSFCSAQGNCAKETLLTSNLRRAGKWHSQNGQDKLKS